MADFAVPDCTCPECNGTGAYKSDCWLCAGERIIKVEKALAEGFSEGDLEEVYDGECDCPADECWGDSCVLCEGYGRISERERDDEITRVLIYGLTQSLPPRLSRNAYGRVVEGDELLARFAGGECREKGWVRWYGSILGDELSLTPAGKAEADSRAWGWARRRDVTLGPVDDFGRLDDDGAPVYGEAAHG